MKSNWKKFLIADLCSNVTSGGTPKSTNSEYYDGGTIPWLNTKEVKFNRIYNTEKCITELGLKNSSAKWIKQNNVIIAMYGATAGNVAINKIPLTTNQACCNLEINENIADYKYIYYYLLNNYNVLSSMANGGAQQNLNSLQIKNFEILLPSLNEQRQIASILSIIDDKIELNNSLNNNLEQQAFALFNNKFESINDGNMTIGDYIKPKRGKNLLSKDAIYGDVPVVAGGLSPATYHNVSNTTAPVITISASGANAGYVNLWHIPVWSSDSSFIDYDMTKNVYFWYVLLKKRQQEIFDSQTGSAQPHIYPQHIEVMPLSEINQEEINIYTQRVTPLFKLIGHNLRENTRLIQLRDTLLPKLMSGEIDVSNVDISTDKLSFSEK